MNYSNLICMRTREPIGPAPIRVSPTETSTAGPADMFEEFDQHIERLEARFGDKQPKVGLIYRQRFAKGRFDAYGFGNVHNSVNQHLPKDVRAWNRPFPMPADLRAIAKHLKANAGKTLVLGYKSDAFMWMDNKYQVGKSTLKLANEHGVKLRIRTMSDLIACEDYADLVVAGGHEVEMNLGFNRSEEIERATSPGAPSLKRRLNAANSLLKRGVKVDYLVNVKPGEVARRRIVLAGLVWERIAK